MATLDRIYRTTCHVCGLPALTYDDHDRPTCSTHAETFRSAPDQVDEDLGDEAG